MTKTKTILLVTVAIVLIAAAVAVKLVFFPSAKDAWFTMTAVAVRQAPAGLVIVRPTHFPNSARHGFFYERNTRRMMGRDVTLKQLIAAAYGQPAGRIALPPDAPKINYDFLVTAPGNQQQLLQNAIRKKLGYTAQMEMHDTEVLALKIEDPDAPGLKISPDNERANADVKNGRLYFTHQRLTMITGGLEQMLQTPVVDKTDTTNFYDFSLPWDAQTQQALQNGTLDQTAGEKILADWGLGLEPDTASLNMLVVKKL
ncbi:MAG TPA: TIGR03435 family protein [Verrucomicrobiae bacterium]|nr:TIGR03435 family protein [Verrucomicrobiae bacterium]